MASPTSLLLLLLQLNSSGHVEKQDGIMVNDKSFPWETVMDRGKILGCVYDSRFFSLGSILILESLPRKCELAKDRNGRWEQLSESEMLLFKENVETQSRLEKESTFIGSDPITPIEARVIRYLRAKKRISEKKSD